MPAAWANQPNPRGMLASDSVASAQEQAQAQSFDARGAMASDSVDAALASERSRRAAAQFYANSTRGTVLVDRTDPVSAKNSGRDVEWPQVGVGFGLGLLLAIGLVRRHALHADPHSWLTDRVIAPATAATALEAGRSRRVATVYFASCSGRRSRTGGAAWRRGLNAVVRPLARLGLTGPRTHLLTVPGRKTGKLWSTPVSIVEDRGERWLVAPYGDRNWVKNARAAGWVELRRGRRHERLDIDELSPEAAVPVLRRYYELGRVTRPFFRRSARVLCRGVALGGNPPSGLPIGAKNPYSVSLGSDRRGGM